MILLVTALAFAGEPLSCAEVSHAEAPENLSVAWVSPVGRRVGRRGEVFVVPSGELRSWVAQEGGGSVGRMLQRLGLRKRAKNPKRRYKVVVFDVHRGDLCRPVSGHEEPVPVSGALSCSVRESRQSRSRSGCGYTVDRATSKDGVEMFRGSWTDLARNGFCVLPAERFVEAASAAR